MIYRGIFIGKWLNWLQKWGINNGKFPISSLVRCCVDAQTILPWKFSICIIYCQLESPQSFFFTLITVDFIDINTSYRFLTMWRAAKVNTSSRALNTDDTKTYSKCRQSKLKANYKYRCREMLSAVEREVQHEIRGKMRPQCAMWDDNLGDLGMIYGTSQQSETHIIMSTIIGQ